MPDGGCIPELVHRAEEDGALSKILNRKTAMSVAVLEDPRKACVDHVPTIISFHRKSKDENDELLGNGNAWESLAGRLG